MTIFILVILEAWSTLFDLVFKTGATIVGLGLSLKLLFKFVHWCLSNNYEADYDTGLDLFSGASYIQKETFDKEIEKVLKTVSSSPTLQETPAQKPTVGYDFSIKEIVNDRVGATKTAPPGSQKAIDDWNSSEERQALLKRKNEIENKIATIKTYRGEDEESD